MLQSSLCIPMNENHSENHQYFMLYGMLSFCSKKKMLLLIKYLPCAAFKPWIKETDQKNGPTGNM